MYVYVSCVFVQIRIKIMFFYFSKYFLFLFQIPESNANCLIDSFLQQLRRVYLVPGEFDGNVIRNMVVVFFLNNLDEYKVSVTTNVNSANSHEYESTKMLRIHMNKHHKRNFFQDPILQELEGTGLSIGTWCMKQLNPNQYLDITFMFLLHEMTKVF